VSVDVSGIFESGSAEPVLGEVENLAVEKE